MSHLLPVLDPLLALGFITRIALWFKCRVEEFATEFSRLYFCLISCTIIPAIQICSQINKKMHISKEWFYTAYFALPWCLDVISPLSNSVIHKSRIKWLYLTNKTAVKTLKCNVSSSIEIWMLDCEGNTEYPRCGMEYYMYRLDKERNPSTKPNNNMKCTDYSNVLSYRREIGMCDE